MKHLTHDLDTAAQIHCIVFADISLRAFCGHSEKLHTNMGWCWRHLVRRIWVTNEINSHVIVLNQFIYHQSMYALSKTDVHDWSRCHIDIFMNDTQFSLYLTSRQQKFCLPTSSADLISYSHTDIPITDTTTLTSHLYWAPNNKQYNYKTYPLKILCCSSNYCQFIAVGW